MVRRCAVPPAFSAPASYIALFAPLAVIIVCAGCGAGADANTGFVVRDSAGIRIVENSAAVWSDGEGWHLAPEPNLHIGVLGGDTVYQFDGIVDIARLSDGRIAVADGGSKTIRVYDSDGRFLLAKGGQGEGPGEFEEISDIEILPGDSIAVYDDDLLRLTIFGPGAEAPRTTTLRLEVSAPIGAIYRLADGSYMLGPRGWSTAQLGDAEPQSGAIYRAPTPVLRYSPATGAIDTIGIFPGTDMAIAEVSGRTFFGVPPFRHALVHAVSGNGIYIGTQITDEILTYTPEGALREIIRGPDRDLTVTDAMVDTWRQQRLDAMPEDAANRQMLEQLYRAMPVPETRAAFGSLLMDAGNHLWVEVATPLSREAEPTRWTVFDSGGRMLGTVQVPARFRVYEIGDDYVLGRWTDQFDVQYVRMYTLLK